ncbi:MAG: hypothetical protein O7E52_14815 [Candidatus Poribacteria bacterium]|nr:hypothetical protein [Candidatus Poribacteria bacterium]
MYLENRQLDLSKICVDLNLQPNLRNERSCAIGHSLVEGINATTDATVYFVPDTAESTEKCRVILHDHLAACTCSDWQVHHRDGIYINPMSSAWICPHGASVLLSLGRSDTYLDFVKLELLGATHHA